MGLNGFIGFVVCGALGYSPAEALGAVFVAGVLFVIASVTPLRAWIINSIPKSLKLGIGAGLECSCGDWLSNNGLVSQ